MPAKLVIKHSESGKSFEFDLVRDETHLGRAADRNEIVLDEGQVSRQHALVRRVGPGFSLIDLNSANGTFINGERITEHTLTPGDVFSISKFTLEFSDTPTTPVIKYEEHKMGNTVLITGVVGVSLNSRVNLLIENT